MDILREAKQYVKQGFLIVPLHGINEEGDCTCRKGKDCGPSSGKHPRINKWPDNATNDIKVVEGWLKKWPGMNIGVRLGPVGDLVDIEYDTSEGRETADRLLGNFKTPTFESERSIHRLFRYPDGFIPLKSVKKIDGLEIRFGTDKKGAQSVLPPSKHLSGVNYDWMPGRSLLKTPIASFPDNVLDLILGQEERPSVEGSIVEKQNTNEIVLPEPSSNGDAYVMAQEACDLFDRAMKYVDTMPGAVQGEEGDKRTFRVACIAAIDFGLPHSETMQVLKRFNQRCEPLWTIEELEHKADKAIEEAAKKPNEVGSKLDSDSIEPTKTKAKDKAKRRSLAVIPFSEIDPVEIDWLWPERIALGKLTLIVGEPGLGKTFAAIDIASRVSTGRNFPDGTPCVQGKVLFLTCEDGPADTIRPRLDAHEADVANVLLVDGVEVQDDDKQFINFQQHLAVVEEYLKANHDIRLFVIDPISAFLGDKVDSHNNTQVRSILGPFCELAERYQIAILGITHLAKSDAKAINRVIGSIAFVAAARAAWLVAADDDDDDRRLFLPIKNNLSQVNGLAYRITDGRCQWEDGEVMILADEVGSESTTPREEAKQWLLEALANGPMKSAAILKLARADGICERTLNRAKKELKVKSIKEGDSWCWTMPPVEPEEEGRVRI